jgi:hypothetical protein
MLRSIGLPELTIILGFCGLLVVLMLVPYWKIFSKAGWNGAMSLLMLLPLASLIVLWVFAFSDWPALRREPPAPGPWPPAPIG